MRFIADLHIHSHYSTATSKNLVPEFLDYWARIKGVNILGTGDCIHPVWLSELKERLEPAENGLYRLKPQYRLKDHYIPSHRSIPSEVFFILTGEISSIYKKGGRVRKVHNLCVFPDFEAVERFQARLSRVGNIASDGRPILGLDSRYLLEYLLESSKDAFVIPAHIWTPWFSVLGSKSGFDSIEECFGDLTPHIFAVETGLSSDPPMNRACRFLDRFTLVSNSDAHSPDKIGREANLFDTEVSYTGLYNALKCRTGFIGTIEFFPQEGKYHYDGHRKCGIKWSPLETIKNRGVCTVCGRAVTKGVMFRVAELADRMDVAEIESLSAYSSITSLPDLLSEILCVKGSSSKRVRAEYMRLIERLGSEFEILLFSDIDEIGRAGGEILREGIRRLRKGEVIIEEGYDGEFGRIRVFTDEEIKAFSGDTLFSVASCKGEARRIKKGSIEFDIGEFKRMSREGLSSRLEEEGGISGVEDMEQRQGIEHFEGPCMVIAGPGAGKTRVLTKRIIHLIKGRGIEPSSILALAFSNKAAGEIRERVEQEAGDVGVNVSTFHAFGLSILRRYYPAVGRREGFIIIGEDEKGGLIASIAGLRQRANSVKRWISAYKQGREVPDKALSSIDAYERALINQNAFDLDDLIYIPVRLLERDDKIRTGYTEQYPWILVDEFQDINAMQYKLLRLLSSGERPNLFVIGDPDQAIYGFRGSAPAFMDRMLKDYPSTRLIRLGKSYRCPTPFLKAGSDVLKKDWHLSGLSRGVKIEIHECDTDKSEAEWTASQIERMIGGVRSFSMDSGISDGEVSEGLGSFSDFCILCRTTAMFDPFIKAFKDHGIPFQVVGTDPFYQREPLAYVVKRFRTAFNRWRIGEAIEEPLSDMLGRRADLSEILKCIMEGMDIPAADAVRLERFAQGFGSDYEDFIISTSLRRGVDDYDDRMEAVSLMTLHASKGLEFGVVFIAGCEEGIIPFELFGHKEGEELREEERLFYVGITRAKRYLFLTHARKRQFKGRVLNQKRSQLIDRMEEGLKRFIRQERGRFEQRRQLKLF